MQLSPYPEKAGEKEEQGNKENADENWYTKGCKMKKKMKKVPEPNEGMQVQKSFCEKWAALMYYS